MERVRQGARCGLIILLLLLLLPACSVAQDPSVFTGLPTTRRTLPEIVVFILTSLGSPIFPPAILRIDTAIAVRYVLMIAAANYNTQASCDPRALSFFGVRDAAPTEVCSDPDQRSLVLIYAVLRALELEFPLPTRLYQQYLRNNGIDPENRSTNKSTAIGFGNSMGVRIASWFAKDGWNSLGDLTRDNYRQRFEDFSNYKPVNSPTELRFPLRWQPLVQNLGNGRFASQIHVVPFLGSVRPLLLTPREIRQRRAPKPYRDMNARRLSGRDARTLDGHIRAVLGASARLTPRQRFLARFWENKFLSVGIFGVVLADQAFGTEAALDNSRWFLGEMMAQHDAMVLAWKEKRRFDAVRPKTAVARRLAGRTVTAFVSREAGVRRVAADDWEPLVPTQPHSEYPSASALLCSASWEHASFLAAEGFRRNNRTEPPVIRLDFPENGFPFDQEGITSISFDSFEEAARSCGVSRIWAGVHFPPSVPAGLALGKGIGRRAYEFVRDLANGKVPERCVQCPQSA